MDRGAWQATVHRVAKSEAQLQRLSNIIQSHVFRSMPSAMGVLKKLPAHRAHNLVCHQLIYAYPIPW